MYFRIKYELPLKLDPKEIGLKFVDEFISDAKKLGYDLHPNQFPNKLKRCIDGVEKKELRSVIIPYEIAKDSGLFEHYTEVTVEREIWEVEDYLNNISLIVRKIVSGKPEVYIDVNYYDLAKYLVDKKLNRVKPTTRNIKVAPIEVVEEVPEEKLEKLMKISPKKRKKFLGIF